MARQKNALTKHFVAKKTDTGEPEWLRLAKWISNVSDDSDEEVEDTAYYDGDGTPEDDVTSVKKKWTFEGLYDDEDPGMKFVADLEFDTGEARKIMYKQERTNGDVFEGPATITEIKIVGGEASEYPEFGCTVAWDKKPEKAEGDSGK